MDPYVGEIRPVAFNFAPVGWALCQGQLMSIAQNSALFSLLGTNFGGDGRTSFGLPNLQGRIALSSGTAPGLSSYQVGEMAGVSTVSLTLPNMPAHGHTLPVSPAVSPGTNLPGPATVLGGAPEPRRTSNSYYVNAQTQAGNVAMMANVVGPVGGNQAHNNMAPYLAIQYIIALQGVFPQRP